MLQIIGIDADDTLWDEASLFENAERSFVQFVTGNTHHPEARDKLREIHGEIIQTHGYGVAGYRLALSRFSQNEVVTDHVDAATRLASQLCDMIERAPIAPLEGVSEALTTLGEHASLILITKGQEEVQIDKLERSGLASAFADVIVVEEKCSRVYKAVFGPSKVRPHAAMIGNSLKSDVLPALEAGAFGLHVPFGTTSPLEVAATPDGHPHFRQFETLGQAARWIIDLA